MTPARAEEIAVEVFTALAADPDRLARFMAVTGAAPDSIRVAARDPAFLAGVLDYVMMDEPLLIACATAIGHPPETISRAHMALSPPPLD